MLDSSVNIKTGWDLESEGTKTGKQNNETHEFWRF